MNFQQQFNQIKVDFAVLQEMFAKLQIDDRVKVTYGNQYYGDTGTIVDIVRGFIVVEMDSDGEEVSMHSSDVEKIEDDREDEDFSKKKQKFAQKLQIYFPKKSDAKKVIEVLSARNYGKDIDSGEIGTDILGSQQVITIPEWMESGVTSVLDRAGIKYQIYGRTEKPPPSMNDFPDRVYKSQSKQDFNAESDIEDYMTNSMDDLMSAIEQIDKAIRICNEVGHDVTALRKYYSQLILASREIPMYRDVIKSK